MKNKFSPYIGLFKMNMIKGFSYRAAAWSGLATQFFWGIMYLLLFTAFYKTGNAPADFSPIQMASYVWLGQAFFVLRAPIMKKDLADQIISGNICYHYVRPLSLYNHWYASIAGEQFSGAIFRCIPIIIFSILLPLGYSLTLPISWLAFIMFFFSLLFGALLNFSITMFFLYIVSLTLERKGPAAIISTLIWIFGGGIPIPLFPEVFQNILSFMPFRYISDLPFRIYVGNINIASGFIQIAIQLAWLVSFIIIGKLLYKKMEKKVVIQGG